MAATLDWQGVVVRKFPEWLVGCGEGGHGYGVRHGRCRVLAVQRGDFCDLLLAQVCQHALAAHCAVQTLPLTRRAALIGAVQQEVLQARPTSAAPLEGPSFTDGQRVVFVRVITLGKDEKVIQH